MFNVLFFWQIESDFLACVDLIYVVSHRETIKYMNNMSGNHELEDETQKNKVRPAGRTLKNPHTISKAGSSPSTTRRSFAPQGAKSEQGLGQARPNKITSEMQTH